MTQRPPATIELTSPSDTSPFRLGQTAAEALGPFPGCQVERSTRADTWLPNSSSALVVELALRMVFDADDRLTVVEFFSDPDWPLKLVIASVVFDYTHACLTRLQAAGVQVVVNDNGDYLMPELNLLASLYEDGGEPAGSLWLSTDDYYAEILAGSDTTRPFEEDQ